MQFDGRTLLVTGGGSGIGRALAERFARAGARVIVAGRTRATLDAVAAGTPGIEVATLDAADPLAISALAADATRRYPELDGVFHVAGIMQAEDLLHPEADAATATAIVETNLLGTIRLTNALLPHLLARPRATIATISSGLAFVPLFATPTYCATKAAIHSYSQSLRAQLAGTSVEVVEIVPPYVQTGLMGEHQKADPNAMPLDAYIDETMRLLETTPTPEEILVERVFPLRYSAESRDRSGYEAFRAQLNAHAD